MTNKQIRDKEALRKSLREHHVELSDVFIGNGSYSIVCKGYCARRNKPTAIKFIDSRTKNEYTERFLSRELDLIPILSHPNVVAIYKIVSCLEMIAIVQEYAEHGDLLQLIKKKKKIDEQEGRFLFRQLIEAIRYLESIDVVHRDLKCENIFLDRYDNIKVGDFGFARFMQRDEESDTHCGSRAYVAPEFLRGEKYTGNESDIWSAGVILYIMLTGRMPYDEKDLKKMLHDQTNHKIRFSIDSTPSKEAIDFIKQMMHPRKELRATTQQIIENPWLSSCRYFLRGEVDNETSSLTAESNSP